jgi:hypothetical protein
VLRTGDDGVERDQNASPAGSLGAHHMCGPCSLATTTVPYSPPLRLVLLALLGGSKGREHI